MLLVMNVKKPTVNFGAGVPLSMSYKNVIVETPPVVIDLGGGVPLSMGYKNSVFSGMGGV